MTLRAMWVVPVIALAACGRDLGSGAQPDYGLGRTATASEIAMIDIDAAPDGAGLPPGRGTVEQGAAAYAVKCAACHGPGGAGIYPLYPPLVGRDPQAANFPFATDPNRKRTIGDYWPYATTLFDYVRRAMPFGAPGSLTTEETYSLTAYLLAANKIIPGDATLDSASLRAVRMPTVDRFVRDNRRGGAGLR
jgi:cytochrome c